MCKTKDSYIHIIISINFVSGYCSLIIRMPKETGLSAKAALPIYSYGNYLKLSAHCVEGLESVNDVIPVFYT